ncbi:hypothetical protein AXG93_2121s1080 [Marchantia polymorpha subsp. ruderalis]|uniref:EF-hand domain-containing protein n=1 Tax=Marchantia polymorpha subsp. ruderalis TaxID=1480154 RepID=A0A176WDU4_MARPO|nr:hypothetical protein AXG93_2121s1080 [Marchantia polymorpha subsp. ruderalis]
MRLYAEFLRQKQRIELEKIRNMEIYQEKIDRDRAYVSKKSWRIWRMRGRTAKQYGNYGELLYSEGLSKMEQLKKMIQKKQEEDEAKELKELTLKPEIRVTFQPHINRQRQHHGLDRDDGYYQETTVFDRLLHYASKLVEKKQMWQQMAAKPVDPTTGQELFTPMTGRKPLQNRNTSELPIGEFLYQLKDTMDRKKQWLAERDLQAKREQASCHYVGPRSQRLLEGIKERRFQQIFDYLDQDKDGFVELETADLNQLSDDVVEDVARIREMGVEKLLDYQSFVDHMKTIQEKAGKNGTVHLVLKHKKHDSPMHIQFKMDRYSRDLAVRRRRFSSSRQWYKLILADRAKWQSDLEALRKERQSLEMKECTFRPEIQKKRGHAKVSRVSHERMGPPASRSFSKIREKEQRESHAGDMTPVGLLESLKSLKQIVAQSESTEGGSPNLPQGQDMQEVYFESRPYPWRPAVERVQSSVVNDLPDPEKQKDGLYVGLLGA